MDQALFHMASPAGLAARGTTSVNLLAPAMILVNLPAMLLFAWVAGRLLGVRQRSWVSVVVCGFTGYLAGGSLALLMAHGDATAPGAGRNALIFAVVFTMAACRSSGSPSGTGWAPTSDSGEAAGRRAGPSARRVVPGWRSRKRVACS
jgi:hypothetical protein